MRRIVHLATAVLLALPATAVAADHGPTTKRLQPSDATTVDLAPARFDAQVAEPGATLRLPLKVLNHTSSPVALRPSVIPLAGSDDPGSFATPADADDRSASAVGWVAFPFARWPALQPDTQLSFAVTVTIPEDAVPGTYALAVGVQQTISGPSIGGVDQSAARVRVNADLVSQLVVTVPGDARASVRLHDVHAPRFVWLHRAPSFRATATNDGDLLLTIDSQVDLDAFLGSAGRTLPMRGPEKGYPTLPGGRRALELRWSDPPLVGWFQPTLVVVGGKGSGVRVTERLDTVYVLPPWWLVLLVLVALWLPVRAWRRRRRAMRESGADRSRARSRVERRLRKQRAQERARAARRQPPRR